MLTNSPEIVMVFGANQRGISSTTYLQNGCSTTSEIEVPCALYLCSDSFCSCPEHNMLELAILAYKQTDSSEGSDL